MEQNKCPNCGASATTISKDGNKVCAYCKYKYPEKKSENLFDLNLGGSNSVERPKINIAILIILLILWWPVGLIYVIVISSKQKEWDKNHGINNNDSDE